MAQEYKNAQFPKLEKLFETLTVKVLEQQPDNIEQFIKEQLESGVGGSTAARPPPPPPNAPAPDNKKKMVKSFAAMSAGDQLIPYEFELESTEPPPGFVDVDISHCGICHSDVHQIDNAWGVATFPLIPGHEIVGNISAVGSGVAKFKMGDRAAIGVQRGSCGACSECGQGLENVCAKILKTYAGPGKDKGGFAKLIRYPASWVFSAPDSLPAEHVGPLMCAGITTYSPLKRLARKGHRVGIIGIGGLGHLALQFARAMGCTVVAISRSPGKEAEARSFGASEFLVTEDAAAMKAAASSFDMILSTVSGHAPLDPYLGLLKPRGSLACVGLPEKDQKSQLFLHSAVITERNIVGSYLGPYGDYEEMLNFAAKHGIKPQVEMLPADQINSAIQKVRDNTARYRMVLVF